MLPPLAFILPAAGRSIRFGGARSKLLEPLGQLTVLEQTLIALLSHPSVACLVLAANDDAIIEHAKSAARGDSRLRICSGGATRAHSVLSALREVPMSFEWVAVHDAARPLVSAGLIDRTYEAAVAHGAAVPALPVGLTIKQAAGPLPARVERTLPRNQLWGMQTPQIARRSDLLDAFERCPIPLEQVTDDMQLIELSVKPVWLVAGEERNIKITTPLDLKIAEILHDTAR